MSSGHCSLTACFALMVMDMSGVKVQWGSGFRARSRAASSLTCLAMHGLLVHGSPSLYARVLVEVAHPGATAGDDAARRCWRSWLTTILPPKIHAAASPVVTAQSPGRGAAPTLAETCTPPLRTACATQLKGRRSGSWAEGGKVQGLERARALKAAPRVRVRWGATRDQPDSVGCGVETGVEAASDPSSSLSSSSILVVTSEGESFEREGQL
eukprot:CAMPEP_0181390128 /NCGR_PEP_ID=MMETSP1106-20121128/25312_1 /TAXON_ID=81844 /ORGANISM="Mantoniella antarctica, Strain SL-175" /LENGTH=211 /DNA_ID=CAMNT_0023511003 /DNA_START=568 /DNA_END=1206 /DNA_ORIENTATION=+